MASYQQRIKEATYQNRMFYEELNSPENQDIFKGLVKPVRVRNQPCDQILYLVDGKDRLSGDSFNFIVDCGKPLRALNATVSRVCVPKLPNINAVNNTFTIWTQNLGTGGTGSTGANMITGTLPIGFYNQTSLQSELKNALDNAAIAGGIDDTYTVAYNNFNKTISITSNVGNKWFFDSTSPFIVYGRYLTGFVGYPAGSSITSVGTAVQYSGAIGLIYSRYIKIKSNRLMANAKETCRTTSFQTNVIAVISLIDQLTVNDFSVTNVFTGSLIMDTILDSSCNLNVAYFMKELGPIDFQLVDEYDFPLNKSLNYGGNYDNVQFDVLIWLNFTI